MVSNSNFPLSRGRNNKISFLLASWNELPPTTAMKSLLLLGALLCLTTWLIAAVEVSPESILKGDWNLTSPFFGARPPKSHPLELHRRGWEACLRCGGAERLGAIVKLKKQRLQDIDHKDADEILDAVRAHGMIVIKGQNLTRAEQVSFTATLGEVIVLPSSFEGKDPEPFHPAIQRITNFWANGTS
jgi:hypothetical protein